MKFLQIKIWCFVPAFVLGGVFSDKGLTPVAIGDDNIPAASGEDSSEKPRSVSEQIAKINTELNSLQRRRIARSERIDTLQGLLNSANEFNRIATTPKDQRELSILKSALLSNLDSLQAEGILEQKNRFLESIEAANDPDLLRQVKIKFLEGKISTASRSTDEILNVVIENESLIHSAPWNEKRDLISALVQSANFNHSEDRAVLLLEVAINNLKSADEPSAKLLRSSAEAILRRIRLPGNELVLTGEKTFDGATFDWSSYHGKVVLVDFWATWCGPCLAEFPNMIKLYETYHDHGFEIIGVSVDSNKESLEQFLEKRKLPWTILHDLHGERNSGALNANYYGINAIPRMILIGRDFKVISTSARGNTLQELLKKEFPDISPGEAKTSAEIENSTKGELERASAEQP